MMILSRLMLNPANRLVHRDLGNIYELHRTVMSGFPEQLPKGERVLFRLDEGRDGSLMLLVQSQTAPKWSDLAGGYLLPADPFSGLDNPAVKAVRLEPAAGQVLNFRLRANPTVKKARRGDDGERKNSNRVPLVKEDDQIAWLQAKAARCGFRLLQVAVSSHSKERGWPEKDKPPLTLFSVRFDGRLQITDAGAFQTALMKGIGSAKGFGCGLLSVAPA